MPNSDQSVLMNTNKGLVSEFQNLIDVYFGNLMLINIEQHWTLPQGVLILEEYGTSNRGLLYIGSIFGNHMYFWYLQWFSCVELKKYSQPI